MTFQIMIAFTSVMLLNLILWFGNNALYMRVLFLLHCGSLIHMCVLQDIIRPC